MDHIFCVLLVVMIGVGAFGGVINYLLSREPVSEPHKKSGQRLEQDAGSPATEPSGRTKAGGLWTSVLAGIAAALLVPLFLNMISSTVIEQIRGSDETPGDPYRLFIFAGFCLLAAITSKAFIGSLSDYLLRLVRDAHTEAKSANKKVTALVDLQSEPSSGPRWTPDGRHATFLNTFSSAKDTVRLIDVVDVINEEKEVPAGDAEPAGPRDNDRRVLAALAHGPWKLRSLGGIASETDLDIATVAEILGRLADHGLAGRTVGSQGERWYITPAGSAALS
jgi:hypothetical protein